MDFTHASSVQVLLSQQEQEKESQYSLAAQAASHHTVCKWPEGIK